jgi:hypothetical protein
MVENIENIRREIQAYVEVKFDLIRLHTAEHLSRILTDITTVVISGYLLFLILTFISLAAGFFFGSLLGSNEAGFLCVAGFYFLLLCIFLALRKKIVEKPVIKAVVRLLFPKFTDDEKK